MNISSHLVLRFYNTLPTLLVQHGWGALPGRMHNESEELRGSGVLQGHSGHAWLGSTPRPDAETNTHEMHGWVYRHQELGGQGPASLVFGVG